MQSISTGPGPQRVPDHTISVKLHIEDVAATNSRAAFVEYTMFVKSAVYWYRIPYSGKFSQGATFHENKNC